MCRSRTLAWSLAVLLTLSTVFAPGVAEAAPLRPKAKPTPPLSTLQAPLATPPAAPPRNPTAWGTPEPTTWDRPAPRGTWSAALDPDLDPDRDPRDPLPAAQLGVPEALGPLAHGSVLLRINRHF